MLGATSGGAASQRALAKAKAPSAWGRRAPSEKRHAHCFQRGPIVPFINTARQVMQEYGVTIRERDGVPTFLATQGIESGEAPMAGCCARCPNPP